MVGRETLVHSSPDAPTAAWRAAPRPRGGRRRCDGAVRRPWALAVGTVIWASGFRTDHAWIDVPVPDNRGRPVHQRGVTGSPGLCFPGLTWQHPGSALLGWVKDDAEDIAHQIDVGG